MDFHSPGLELLYACLDSELYAPDARFVSKSFLNTLIKAEEIGRYELWKRNIYGLSVRREYN